MISFMIRSLTILLFCIFISLISCSPQKEKSRHEYNIVIPVGGNAWVRGHEGFVNSDLITKNGVEGWENPETSVRTFFYVEKPVTIALGLRAKISTKEQKLVVIFNDVSRNITLSDTTESDVFVGDFTLDKTGYYSVDIKKQEESTAAIVDISSLLVYAPDTAVIKFAKDDFYFARRGPSDHLRYTIPDGVEDIRWFYSEIRIPQHQDVIGSYFMADGFREGYFGIQVNSSSERRILFSIWSPYKTDNPSEVPEKYKIKLLKKGVGVTTGEFGSEGTGGQSYKVFNWKAETTYGFLVGANPVEDSTTIYSAYFYDPEVNTWNLIASFQRPKTKTYLKNLYSFLENFIPEQGVFARRGLYQNQWVYDKSGWHQVTQATYTADNTARKEYRFDYSGGVNGSAFYLQNCGFTNDHTEINTELERASSNAPPQIDFSRLR